jgi:hypothetical protein
MTVKTEPGLLQVCILNPLTNMMALRLKEEIPPGEINNESEEFSLEASSLFSDGRLQKDEEIIANNLALFSPPVLVSDSGRLITAAGKQIIAAYRHHNRAVPCALIIDKPKDKYAFLKYLIYAKKELSGLNVIEKSFALQRCLDLRNKIEEEVRQLLDIPKSPAIIKKYLALSGASDKVKTLILNGTLHEYTAFEIFSFLKEDWDLLADFIAGIFLGTKKRNKLLNLIFEITQRDQTDARSIIQTGEIKEIFKLPFDPPQIGEKVFEHIEKLRYPFIWRYKKTFNEQLRNVKLDRNMQLAVPENFEQRKFKLSFTFSSIEDFNEQVKKFKMIGASSSFKKLMQIK